MLIHAPARIAAYRARGWWGDMRLHDLLAAHAQRVPERESLVDPPNLADITGEAPQRLNWGEVARRVERMAAALLAAGIVKDDVVLLQMANTHELPIAYLACMRIGAVVSPVVVQYREHELRHVLTQTQARAMMVSARIGSHDHAAMAVALAAQTTTPFQVFVAGPAAAVPDGAIDLRARMAAMHDAAARLAAHESAHPVTADDAVTLLWTSGSEGRPKGVARTHNDWMLYGRQFGADFGIGDGCRFLNGRPITTHGVLTGSLSPWLFHAGTLVNHHPFTLPVFLEQLRTEDIHFTALAPAILSMLLAKPELLEGLKPGRMRFVGSGSAPLTEALVQGFEQRFGVQVINFFGSTEGAALVSGPQDMPEAALRALYFPRFGAPGVTWKHPAGEMVETRLVDAATGEDITGPGRVGELRYRGPMVMSGYWRAPDLTAAAFDEQGFFKSGDLFEITGPGGRHLRFAGRVKDIIIRGGFNISAEEIENLVASHPAVAEVAVVGYADERMGEKVCACVVPRAGAALTLEALTGWLRSEKQVAVIKLPERLLLLEALPRSPNNKVVKGELRARARAPQPPQASTADEARR